MRGLSMEAVLERAVAEHHPRLIMLCSFQKEESVLVDALLRIAPDARIATIDTGVLFPDTLSTWRAFEERFGADIEVFDAQSTTTPWSGPEHCCSDAKVAALEAALSGVDAWITGLRREQGPTRADTEPVEFDERRGIWKFNPLAEWTDRDLWERISERDLPYHPLHDQGYESIGCAPCTQAGAGREGRWAGSDKTECGLHVEPPAATGAI
jgi:phosphoadenosine phosphosulfate reductase